MFSCEYCKIYKNTNFVEHLQTGASGIFIVEHNNAKKQKIIKFNESFLNTKYHSEHIKTYKTKKSELKSDCWFYEYSSVLFQKNESLSARKERLVHKAGHEECCLLEINCSL